MAQSTDAERWNNRYRMGDTPWHHDSHADFLETTLDRLTIVPARALDLGCGLGRNAYYLARRGFQVLGVDISEVAIAGAISACPSGLDVSFAVVDALRQPIPGGPFSFVFDFGCVHVFGEDVVRQQIVAKVADAMEPGGTWVSWWGSADGPPGNEGPPRRTARDIVSAVEPHFEVVQLSRGVYRPGIYSWECVFQKRAVYP